MQDLALRAFRPGDFDALHDLVSRWEVTRMLGSWPWPADAGFTRARCAPFKGEGFIWATCLADRAVGLLGITGGSLGYMLHPDVQGQGLMGRAVPHALRRGFETEGLAQIDAVIWSDNHASRRLLEKSGFVRIAEEIRHAKARGAPTPSETYRLDRARWQGLSVQA